MRLSVLPRLIVVSTAVFAVAVPAQADGAPATSEPIVGLRDGKIAQCGARLIFDRGREVLLIEVDLTRQDGGARLGLRAVARQPSGAAAGLEKLEAATASVSSAELFAAPAPSADAATLIYERDASDPRVTTFIQELMVSGARFRLLRSDGVAFDLDTTGPLPQSTRAAYLNCAGDLYRPAE